VYLQDSQDEMTFFYVASLNRNIQQPMGPNNHELRIGYLKGINDEARPPSVANPFEGKWWIYACDSLKKTDCFKTLERESL